MTRVSPSNDVKATRTYRGQTGNDPGKLIERIQYDALDIYGNKVPDFANLKGCQLVSAGLINNIAY